MEIHMELERRLAAFKKVEAVVVFQSGFAANAGTVSAILGKDDVVVSDELNHASIIDGCRLSRAAIKVFPHKDADAARKILRELPATQRKLLITDGVFSMDGDLGPLPALCDVAEEFGYEMSLEPGALFSESPVLVDGRMLPHEWIHTPAGDYQKVDAASHGDDHFFPGPSDIAWDLAGAIVEWNMSADAHQRFIDVYRRVSGDDPRERIAPFVVAYAVFRCGYCLMAAEAVRGSGEEHRLLAAHDRYRAVVESCLPQSLAA
jgi:hypothetical protein